MKRMNLDEFLRQNVGFGEDPVIVEAAHTAMAEVLIPTTMLTELAVEAEDLNLVCAELIAVLLHLHIALAASYATPSLVAKSARELVQKLIDSKETTEDDRREAVALGQEGAIRLGVGHLEQLCVEHREYDRWAALPAAHDKVEASVVMAAVRISRLLGEVIQQALYQKLIANAVGTMLGLWTLASTIISAVPAELAVSCLYTAQKVAEESEALLPPATTQMN